MTAAAIGAALGDWLSYWLGYHYHEQIQAMWPLKDYPKLLENGHKFFRRWGVWAIVIGRFSGPLRASVPIVAGITEMPWLQVPARQLELGLPVGVRAALARHVRRPMVEGVFLLAMREAAVLIGTWSSAHFPVA